MPAQKLRDSAALEVVLRGTQDLLPHADLVFVRLAGLGLIVGDRRQTRLLHVDGDAATLLGQGDFDAGRILVRQLVVGQRVPAEGDDIRRILVGLFDQPVAGAGSLTR